MTMFSRNDKSPDPAPGSRIPPAEPAAPPTASPSRPQATAQILASPPAPAPAPAPAPLPPQPAAHVPTPHRATEVSVISKALKITGKLESSEDIQINGHIEGDVRGASVTVQNGAKVKGTVSGETVTLAGAIEGKIEARRVVLNRTARMTGDVVHDDISVESGAYIAGHCIPEYGKANGKTAVSKPSGTARDQDTDGADRANA